jgi:hypothetical protein
VPGAVAARDADDDDIGHDEVTTRAIRRGLERQAATFSL